MASNKWLGDLKTVLQVAKARLDVREKKKTEQVAKERYVVADYVRNNKTARARIAVEHLIREDYKIEAMDRVEAYLDTLLMRLQLIKDRPKNGCVDPAVEQPLANVLWAGPFLSQDIPEMVQISNMFKKHFGLEYVSMCEQNKLSMVDVDLLRCLSCEHVPKLLVEKYLVEICRSQNVPFDPDQTIMAQDEFWAIGQRYVQAASNEEKRPPPPPSSSHGSNGASGGGGGGVGRLDYPQAPLAPPSAPQFEKPPPTYSASPAHYPNINFPPSMPAPPPPAAHLPNPPRLGFGGPAPFHDPFPQVPDVNNHSAGGHGGSDDPGFDDLARRFEELKKRK